MIRCYIIIAGDVQGVFFRRFVKENAQQLGLAGWVQNKDDDKVEIVAEGEEDKIDELISRCRRGPPGADVKDIKIKKEKYLGDVSGFRIISQLEK